jgi:SAM-dependent methyltransferase
MLYSRRPEPGLFSLQALDVDRSQRILDIGCGAGLLLQSLHALGFQNLMGVDPLIGSDIEHESGLRISKRPLEEMDGVWDIVMFHHSFEHLPDPEAELQSVYRLLDDDGCCLIRIPTVSSFAWQHYAIHWVQLDVPRHFYLHSTGSMKMLADRAGFDVVDIRYDSTAFQFWGSEQILRGIALHDERSYAVNPRESIFSKQALATWAERAEELNRMRQGDQAVFYLRKNPPGRCGRRSVART